LDIKLFANLSIIDRLSMINLAYDHNLFNSLVKIGVCCD
jgi:hypothetical protein